MEEYTREELKELIDKMTVDGKVPIDAFAALLFDPRSRQEFFPDGLELLKEAATDNKRKKELTDLLLPVLDEQESLLKEVQNLAGNPDPAHQARLAELRRRTDTLHAEIVTMRKELSEVNARIAARHST